MSDVPASIVDDLAPTGVLRAAINLGNAVLAQGTPDAPSGVTVDIARELGVQMGVPVELVCFDAAWKSFDAMKRRRADVCFLALDPARAEEVAFTAAYVVIEGVFVVPRESAIANPAEVDRDGVRVGVKRGSAYDLFLSRTLERATVVRGDEGVEELRARGLEAGAGIRQPMRRFVDAHPEFRLVDERFMEIRQAVGTTTSRDPETVRFLHLMVEGMKAGGFVADALRRANQQDAAVAPAG